MNADLLDRLDKMPRAKRLALYEAANPGVFAQQRLGLLNEEFHWEWYRLMLQHRRLCVVAPREHAKTSVFTVVQTAWRSIHQPGTWTYVFAATGDQAAELKERINETIEQVAPHLVTGALKNTDRETRYANWSRVTIAGARKAVRSAHPDIIIGDDVLEEQTTATEHQRHKTLRWWKGTVAGMAHPGTLRSLGHGRTITMPATRIYLVGTPFHADDLLGSMRTNPVYAYYRYAAEYDTTIEGTYAVEVA